jgi:hypothetical protein
MRLALYADTPYAHPPTRFSRVPDPGVNRRATVICPSGTRSGRRLARA